MKRKSAFKKVLKNISIFILPFLIIFIVRSIGLTLRYSYKNMHSYTKAKSGGNCIFVFWHQKFFPLLYLQRTSRMNILVSRHRDGELIARALKFLGFTVIRGSSTSGGMKACRLMVKAIKQFDLAITPDGPKGPPYHFSGGAIAIAKFSGRPIVPIGIGAKCAKYFSSWDRFMFPLPMSRISIVFGNVHILKKSEEDNVIRDSLTQELNELNRIAESFR